MRHRNNSGTEIQEGRTLFHGSSDDSDGDEIHHYARIAFVNDVFPRVDRERKEDIYNDGGEMPIFTYSGSDTSV